MISYFLNIYRNTKAIVQGHWITLRYMFKPSVTIHYPDEKLVPFEKFRGALLFDAETCIACNLCVKACPSGCILLENAQNETGKKIAKVAWYSIDFGKCNFCRLCEEACPTKPKSVWHSLDYELLFANRDEMVWLWKKGIDFVGQYYDRKTKEYKAPTSQIPIQTTAARR